MRHTENNEGSEITPLGSSIPSAPLPLVHTLPCCISVVEWSPRLETQLVSVVHHIISLPTVADVCVYMCVWSCIPS